LNEDIEFVLDRVTRNENMRAGSIKLADEWEKMYRLDPGFNRTLAEAVGAGQEQIILPTPFMTVQYSERLLSSTPRIDVVPQSPMNRQSVEYSETCEKWLIAALEEMNISQQRNVMADMRWHSLVRGRWALEVKWIYDQLPKNLRKKRPPFLLRALEPKNVGIVRNPYTTEFAYHKYEDTLLNVFRRWSELKDPDPDSDFYRKVENYRMSGRDVANEDQMVTIIDYWETEEDTGNIRNMVLVDDCEALPLEDSGYPDIPILCGRGDFGVGMGDEFDGLSILHPINGLWQYDCRNKSQMATMLLWYAWPAITVQNEAGGLVDDIDIIPGQTTSVPAGTQITIHQINPNVPLAEVMSRYVNESIQLATYPYDLLGQPTEQMLSGYSASVQADAAKGRIKNFQESLEMGISSACRMLLSLVEKFGGKKGVTLYAMDTRDNVPLELNINKDMIKGIRQINVSITPNVPQDNMALMTMGKQNADAKYLSAQTYRDEFMGVSVPSDEARRIALEELMQSDELRPYRLRRAAEDYFGEDALDMLYGTELMPEPPPGMEWVKGEDGRVQLKEVPPPPPPPDEPPMDMMGPPPGGPPMGPPGMPPMDMGAMPPGGPPLQPDATFAGPLGGGFPPQTQGQLQGENFGLPQDLDPAVLDMLLNQAPPGGPVV
jgi:hypothetical protein